MVRTLVLKLIRPHIRPLALVHHGISALESQLAGVQPVPERLRDVTDSMKVLGRRASPKPYKVAVVGRTGIVLDLFTFSAGNRSIISFPGVC
jgi:hypothetical protein